MSRLMTKPSKWHVRPAKTQISLGICPVWSESSLSAWRKLGSLATDWAHGEDSDQIWLLWVFAGHTVILLVLSWGGSNQFFMSPFFLQKKWQFHKKCILMKKKIISNNTVMFQSDIWKIMGNILFQIQCGPIYNRYGKKQELGCVRKSLTLKLINHQK